MKIKDVTCKKLMRIYILNGSETYTLEDTDYVKGNWDKMSDEEKKGWYTTSEHTFIPYAEHVFDDILESLTYWDYRYYGIDDIVEYSVVTDENKEKLQMVLNEIFSNDDCKSYFINEKVE